MDFFETRSDVDTDFSVSIEKTVNINKDYEDPRNSLIETIKGFNKIEDKYFGLEYVVDDLLAFRRKQFENKKPLFS
ncbi:MAG: hypothetical protein WAM95_20215 [Bacillus sp. (in: firmicutes)]